MFYSFEKRDPFNNQNRRNGFNTDRDDYNCGGFALGTYSWYIPDPDGSWFGFRCYDLDEEDMEEVTVRAVEKMLLDFPDLRVISTLAEIQANEYGIAFRVSSDGDFHFCKQFTGNLWYHKPGRSKIRSITEEEVLSADWYGRYDGKLFLFAKKKNNA